MHRSQKFFKQMVDDAIRSGLRSGKKTPRPKFVVSKPVGLWPEFEGVSFNRLVDDLEGEAVAEKMRRTKSSPLRIQ